MDAFTRWLEALEETQHTSKTAIEALKQAGVDGIPDELQNYPQKAWQNLKQNDGVAPTAGDYVTRTDDAKRPIPHVCFKVPTGGGKTLLAAAALERLHRQRGLTLWINYGFSDFLMGADPVGAGFPRPSSTDNVHI